MNQEQHIATTITRFFQKFERLYQAPFPNDNKVPISGRFHWEVDGNPVAQQSEQNTPIIGVSILYFDEKHVRTDLSLSAYRFIIYSMMPHEDDNRLIFEDAKGLIRSAGRQQDKSEVFTFGPDAKLSIVGDIASFLKES